MRLLALYRGRYYRLLFIKNKWVLTTYRKDKTDDTFTWMESEKVYFKELKTHDPYVLEIKEYHCDVHFEDLKYPMFRKLFQVDGTYNGPFNPDLTQDFVCINTRKKIEERMNPQWVEIPDEDNMLVRMINLDECREFYIASRSFYVKNVEMNPPRTKYRKVSKEEFKNMLCEIMYP